jgi:hypothetical protein
MTASPPPSQPPASTPSPRFRRQGRAWQLRLDSLADLRHALDLDEALWVANSAPAQTLVADPTFLNCLDPCGEGRVRGDAVRDAIRWLLAHLQTEPLGRPDATTLCLDALRPEGPDADRLLTAARKTALRFGEVAAKSVSLDQVRQIIGQAGQGGFDKPGQARPDAAASSEVRELIQDALAGLPPDDTQPSPEGITGEQLEQFLSDARAYLGWLDQAPSAAAQAPTSLMPLGAATTTAFGCFSALQAKVDQFFALCDALRFSRARLAPTPPVTEAEAAFDWSDPGALRSRLEQAPMAWPSPDGKLDFTAPINPRWGAAAEELRHWALEPLLGAPITCLDAGQWRRVKQLFAPHAEWRAREPATPVSRVPPHRLRRYLDQPDLAGQVRVLIANSRETAFDLDNLRLLERLILFQAHLLRLGNSFINCSDLYGADRRALFEMGTLIMDGRRFTFSMKVVDRSRHARFSNASNMFVLYAEITGDQGARLYEVAVPVTAGTKGTLQVDKWGTFIDREGQARNARIVQIVENPISLREAIAAPFKRLGRSLMTRFGEKSAEEEKKLEGLTGQAFANGAALPSPTGRPPAPSGLAGAGGMLAGGGIALAALGSSLAFITKTLTTLRWPSILAGLVGAAAAVIVPVTLVAMVKLAGRDLSCMLEGSGWGINARMALTPSLAGTFTRRPVPPILALEARDRRRFWWCLLVLVLALAVATWLLQRR